MTENLLQKLEEKVLTLLAEMETLRNELKQARFEITSLKSERIASTDKLKNLIVQLDALSWAPSQSTHTNEQDTFSEKPILETAY